MHVNTTGSTNRTGMGIGSDEQMDSKKETTRVDVEELTERRYAKEQGRMVEGKELRDCPRSRRFSLW